MYLYLHLHLHLFFTSRKRKRRTNDARGNRLPLFAFAFAFAFVFAFVFAFILYFPAASARTNFRIVSTVLFPDFRPQFDLSVAHTFGSYLSLNPRLLFFSACIYSLRYCVCICICIYSLLPGRVRPGKLSYRFDGFIAEFSSAI